MWKSRLYQRDLLRFFRDHAETVQWYRGAVCPCRSSPASSPNTTCAACGGLGWWYPADPTPLRVVMTQVTQRQNLLAEGLELRGDDLIADFAPGAPLVAWGDLLWPQWRQGEPYEGQTLVRGTGTTDALFYGATTVSFCGSVDLTTGAATVYTEGVDFSVSGKTVTWLGTANQPAAGSLYTIRYNAQFEWVVFDPPQVRVERGTSLGPKAILRKRHLVLQNLPGVLGG